MSGRAVVFGRADKSVGAKYSGFTGSLPQLNES